MNGENTSFIEVICIESVLIWTITSKFIPIFATIKYVNVFNIGLHRIIKLFKL